MRRSGRAALLCLALALATTRVAAASTVVVLRPSASEPSLRESANRIEGELRAAGFAVVVVDHEPGKEPRAALEEAATGAGAFAAVAVLPAGGGSAADVWVVDRATGKTLIRTVEVSRRPGESAEAALAIRAVELLRASLLEADAAPPPGAADRRTAPLAPDVSRWMAPPPAPRRQPLEGPALYAGAGVLHSFAGIGPAFGPILGASYGLPSGAGARLTFAGPALGGDLELSNGTASVRQELATLEAFFARELGDSRWIPAVSLGVGAYHLHAVGALAPPYRGTSDETWAVLVAAGLGLGLRIDDRLWLELQGRAVLTEPGPVVVAAGTALGRAGRPSILATLGVGVGLGR